MELGCILVVGQFDVTVQMEYRALQADNNIQKCSNTGVGSDSGCACLKRQLPPSDALVLLCALTEDNLPMLRNYILKQFASSAFNCCERQPLPLISDSPPSKILVGPEASPIAVPTLLSLSVAAVVVDIPNFILGI